MVSGSGVFGRAYESRFTIERVGEEEDHMAMFQATHRYEKGLKHTIHVEYDKARDEGFEVRFLSREEEAMLRGGEVDFDKDGNGKVLQMPKRPRWSEEQQQVGGDVATELALNEKPFIVARVYPQPEFKSASQFQRYLESLGAGWSFELRSVKRGDRVVGYPPGVSREAEIDDGL